LKNGQGIYSPQGIDPQAVRALLEPPLFTPENTYALRVLEEMKRSGKHLTIVIDEYGGVSGMVTLMDLLGAVVSEIPGTGSSDRPQAVQRPDGSWLVDGLLDIDDFKELFKIENLPREDRAGYQTVGGFVVTQLGCIPTPGQSFLWENLTFEILDMDGHRVDKVLVTSAPPNSQAVTETITLK
ncbi:MAG TPA: transporter associated domain-containing protein, partial [Anaerolineaceae bacterium]|nr:transporter associated domain-containing protein [Anaerolineaceae bacterium]